MTEAHREKLHKNRRLAQFRRAYLRACKGKVSWAKVLYLRTQWQGFMLGYLKDAYPVPGEY